MLEYGENFVQRFLPWGLDEVSYLVSVSGMDCPEAKREKNIVKRRPRILFLVLADIDSLREKGVADMILDRDEMGFFERVVTVHPVANKSQVIDLNGTHVVYEIGTRNHLAGKRKYFKIIQFIWAIRDVSRIIRKERVDLVRANDPYWMGLIGWTVSRLLNHIPFCVSVHADYDKLYQLRGGGGSYTVFGSRLLAKLLARFVLSKADMVMPIRESLRQWVIKSGARPSKVSVIPHGVDLSQFDLLVRTDIYGLLKISRVLKIISFVGRLSRENYVDDIIDLASALGRKRKDVIVVMAGDGEEKLDWRS